MAACALACDLSQRARAVLGVATIGVLLTAALTAPAADYMLGFGWVPSFLVGAVVASTDAAAVFLLIHTAACACDRASAQRSKSNPATTIRSQFF